MIAKIVYIYVYRSLISCLLFSKLYVLIPLLHEEAKKIPMMACSVEEDKIKGFTHSV